MKVYQVEHYYEYGKNKEHFESKMIGIFSTKKKAFSTIIKYHQLPGFRDYPIENFDICEIEIDEDSSFWSEGFFSY